MVLYTTFKFDDFLKNTNVVYNNQHVNTRSVYTTLILIHQLTNLAYIFFDVSYRLHIFLSGGEKRKQ